VSQAYDQNGQVAGISSGTNAPVPYRYGLLGSSVSGRHGARHDPERRPSFHVGEYAFAKRTDEGDDRIEELNLAVGTDNRETSRLAQLILDDEIRRLVTHAHQAMSGAVRGSGSTEKLWAGSRWSLTHKSPSVPEFVPSTRDRDQAVTSRLANGLRRWRWDVNYHPRHV
jgi:hypothetical protein